MNSQPNPVSVKGCLLIAALFISASSCNLSAAQAYSEKHNANYPDHVFWGDTHLHTTMSTDANGMGNTMLSPDEAYRFAKGFSVTAHNGQQARLQRPLDFLVVADHAANIGVMAALQRSDPVLLSSDTGQRWYKAWQQEHFNVVEAFTSETRALLDSIRRSVFDGGPSGFFWDYTNGANKQIVSDTAFRQAAWNTIIKAADSHNAPHSFTAFSGYEWTVNTPGTLHRVVIYKGASDKVSRTLPFTKYDSIQPEALWAYMSGYEQLTGDEVIAIPHNSNLSKGTMFALTDATGNPITQRYAEKRIRWEPLAEITQIKGDSETHPLLSPSDQFAGFERWDRCRMEDKCSEWAQEDIQALLAEYIRPALKSGLSLHSQLRVNPFKLGVIGSTDSHTSLATADDNNFWGKHTLVEPSKHRITAQENTGLSADKLKPWRYASSGYAAVWAEENTRESLFAAMKRKEVYASTGPRITVRFFAGWDYDSHDAFKPDLARIGYEKGVPMGGDLTAAPKGKAPQLLIRAVKDPDGANLDRVQVIKGWLDADGQLHEKIYNVALSDGREDKGPDTKRVGNTVDIPDASYTNTIGDPELAVVWTDPDFDKNELAFYYLRVLEIPTPRWTAYDAKYFKLKEIPEEIPMITQERAYTSPIWYTPAS